MDILERFDQVFAPLVKPSPQELSHAIDEARVTLKDLLPHVGEPGIYPYGRKPLFQS